jgi:hypothetical protein
MTDRLIVSIAVSGEPGEHQGELPRSHLWLTVGLVLDDLEKRGWRENALYRATCMHFLGYELARTRAGCLRG